MRDQTGEASNPPITPSARNKFSLPYLATKCARASCLDEALLALRAERAGRDSHQSGEHDDDDDMWEEERSLSTKVMLWLAVSLA